MSLVSRSLPPCVSPRDFPMPQPLLEEIVAAAPQSRAASLAFALLRCRPAAPVMTILPRAARREFGRPGLHGILRLRADAQLLMVVPQTLAEALWAMEQALKSGALGGVIGVIEGATLTQSRRLDYAARDGGTPALLLRTREGGLSAARRRWRIASLPSAANPFDAAAPGALRLHAELVRARDRPPGAWVLDHDPATGGIAVAAALAADRPREIARRAA